MKEKMAKESQRGESRLREILGILIICFSVFLFLSLIGHHESDWPGSSKKFGEPTDNITGRYGAYISHVFLEYAGFTSFAIAVFIIITGVVIFLHRSFKYLIKPSILLSAVGLFLPLLVSVSIDIGSNTTIPGSHARYGGILGVYLAYFMVTYIGRSGTFLLSIAVILVSAVLTTNLKPSTLVEYVLSASKLFIDSVSRMIQRIKTKKKRAHYTEDMEAEREMEEMTGSTKPYQEETPFIPPVKKVSPVEPAVQNSEPRIHYHENSAQHPSEKTYDSEYDSSVAEEYESKEDYEDSNYTYSSRKEVAPEEYILPSIDLLDEPPAEPMSESRKDMLEKAERIVESLKYFNIESEVRQITPGPVVTRYELTLAPGVKVGRVVNLSDDLAMALKAKGDIRILAPIPGKAAIGIEVPNTKRSTVYFKEITESEAFLSTEQPLILALGKNTAGEPVVADLAKMPHLLIAGSTGSGKSVCINTIIASILLKAAPDKVRMILVDPKVVELTIYNSIPHLLTPVVTDTKRAEEALKWAVREMEIRYRQLASLGVRDIHQYNMKIAFLSENAQGKEDTEIPDFLPFIVVIIDEFADLMVLSSNEIEESIARLAQMARAVGIHLVLATQRPSADVITGLIKANFPSRIAFKVMQSSNSRIVLDQNGADKLLGMGDMLFIQVGRPEPIRLHGAFISSDESIRLVDFVSSQHMEGLITITDEIFSEEPVGEDNALGLRDPNVRDSLFFKAARLVVRNNQGSVSLLQRRLKIGYARAARLIDQLELAGIVSPYDGSKAREVLVDDQYIDDLEESDI